MKLQLFHWFEITAFLASIFTIYKIKETPYLFFVPFLLIINIYEIGTVYGWFTYHNSNHAAGNIFMLIHFSFYFFMIATALVNRKERRFIVILWSIFFLFFLGNILFFQHIWIYNSYTYLTGSLMIIGLCCFFFYRIMNVQELNLPTYPFFWIFTGLMFFYLCRFIFMCYFTFFIHKFNPTIIQLFKSISNISIILLYTCMIIGLVCFRPPFRKI